MAIQVIADEKLNFTEKLYLFILPIYISFWSEATFNLLMPRRNKNITHT